VTALSRLTENGQNILGPDPLVGGTRLIGTKVENSPIPKVKFCVQKVALKSYPKEGGKKGTAGGGKKGFKTACTTFHRAQPPTPKHLEMQARRCYKLLGKIVGVDNERAQKKKGRVKKNEARQPTKFGAAAAKAGTGH